jgi:hypothetical protein
VLIDAVTFERFPKQGREASRVSIAVSMGTYFTAVIAFRASFNISLQIYIAFHLLNIQLAYCNVYPLSALPLSKLENAIN